MFFNFRPFTVICCKGKRVMLYSDNTRGAVRCGSSLVAWLQSYLLGPISDDLVHCWTGNWFNRLCCEVVPWAIPDRWCCCSESGQKGFNFSEFRMTPYSKWPMPRIQLSSTRPRTRPRTNLKVRMQCIIDLLILLFLLLLLLLLFSIWYILCLFWKDI